MPNVLPDQVGGFVEAREECDTFQQIAAEEIRSVLCLVQNRVPMLRVGVAAAADDDDEDGYR